jgi:hypothetical protein
MRGSGISDELLGMFIRQQCRNGNLQKADEKL